jgi:putative phosphoesterase
MLLGVISDIHSNLPALEAVVAQLDRLGAEKVICAGDMVGYNSFADGVLGLVKKRRMVSIRGNHDRAVTSGDTSDLSDTAAEAVGWTRKHLAPNHLAWLGRLLARKNLKVEGRKILVVHGSPLDEGEYVLPVKEDRWPFGNPGADLLIMGHTHVQWTDRFERYNLTVVNPGSVGQPRDTDPRAAFAVIDTRDLSVRLHRVEYDIGKTAGAVIAAGLPARLAERLYVGR